ncbi:MAG: hypothetical protein FJX75_11140 [Armatimonadetes bacterium]|nr:hypothetical protein [Armatimonadota bacterium]
MRFLLDEHVYPCLAVYLRFLGHDAEAVAKERARDLMGKPDDVVFSVAVTDNRIVVTFNADDYVRLHEEFHKTGLDHPGIVLSPERRYADFEVVFRWIDRLLEDVPPRAFPNQLHDLSLYMG